MANYLSAGVYASEIDASASVPSVATGIAAYAGSFVTGPAFRRTLITNIDQLVNTFGIPTDSNFNDWFQCYNFLKNGSELYVVRAVSNDRRIALSAPLYSATKYYNVGEIAKFGTEFFRAKCAGILAAPVSGDINNANWDIASEFVTAATDTESIKYAVQVPGGATKYIEQIDSMNGGTGIKTVDSAYPYDSYSWPVKCYNTDMWGEVYNEDFGDTGTAFRIVAKNVGEMGNNIRVTIAKSTDISAEVLNAVLWNGAKTEDRWNKDATYAINDVVIYGDMLWRSLVNSNTKRPGSSFTDVNGVTQNYWEVHKLNWFKTRTYAVNEIVTEGGKLWKAKLQNIGNQPSKDVTGTYWLDVSHAKGARIHYGDVNWKSLIANNGQIPQAGSTGWEKGLTVNDIINGISIDAENKEFVVIVFKDDVVVEKFIVSSDKLAVDEDGNNIYVDSVINTKSKYIWIKMQKNLDYDFIADSIQVPVSGGVSEAPSEDDLMEAYNLFADVEKFDVSIIIANEKINKFCAEISNTRKDCITILGAPYTTVVGQASPVDKLTATINEDGITEYVGGDNSYAAYYGNYIQIFDTFNEKYRWVNIAGAVAGSQIRTNNNRDPWWANAGLERGQILGVTKIAFNPTQGERDVLYRNKINPIVSFPGQGNCIIWGQKTLLSKKSAFDRLNVRQLFLVVEKAVNKAMKYFVFEPNDEFTRAQVTAMIIPFMENIKGRRGVYDYKIICDETINTPETIDNNTLKLNVLIKPTRTAEFVEVKYVAARTDADLAALARSLP